MSNCAKCNQFLSTEDIIRRSVKCVGGKVAFIGSNVNPQPPINALKFEDTEEYIFFESQSEPDYITFETN